MSLKPALLSILYLLMTGMAALQPAAAKEVKAVVKTGYDFSGDPVFTARFTNGRTEKIRANEGLLLGGGVILINDAKTLEAEITLSWKFQDLNASNGDAQWRRYPFDALIFYRKSRMRVGGGLTYHIDPRLQGDGVLSNKLDVSFKDALGAVVAADYLLTEHVSVGLRYTLLEYEEQMTGTEYQSNGGGIGLAIRF